ncbi:MAG: hypothetical protein KAU95_01475 [Candidatus Aenigmarchaeota archaeon]|nr:hypothetical protein [Candidatus Aenigmarchaeota archaeon]
MDKSVYIALALILVVCLVAGFFYFQGEPEPQEFLNNKSLDNLNTDFTIAKSISWNNTTPEYFLDESIFEGKKTVLQDLSELANETELKREKNETVKRIEPIKDFAKRCYDEAGQFIMSARVMEFETPLPEGRPEIVPGTTKIYGKTTHTYLGDFIFNEEAVEEFSINTKRDNETTTKFCLKWSEDRFRFSVTAMNALYQDEIKEIAKNIINRYPK